MKNKKIDEGNILGVNFQIIVTLALVIIAVLYLLHITPLFLLELLIGIDLLIMAYNNHKIYHKENATWYYLGIGIIVIVVAILTMVGVI